MRLYGDIDGQRARRLRWALPLGMAALCFPYGFIFALTAPYLIVPMAAPLAILAMLTIWALPETASPPTRTMTALFGAFFIALFMWPNYLAIALPGLPWITLLRLFGTPAALLFLVSLSVSRSFRTTMSDALAAAPLVWKLVLAFVAIQVLTIPLSAEISSSVSKVVVAQTSWTAIFFISCYAFLKPGFAERWAIVLCLMAVALAALGVVEFARNKVLWAGHIPSFLAVEDAGRYLASARRAATKIYRVKATFGHPLIFAEFLALTMPFFIHFIAGPYRNLVRLSAAAGAALVIHSIVLTDSRLGIVGIFIAASVYLLIWSLLRWRQRRDSVIAPALLFAYPVVFMAAVAATFAIQRLKLMVWGGGAHQASDASRDNQISDGVPKILSNPLGHGAGQAAESLGFFGGGRLTIDNYYLAIALEYGPLGFIIFYGMILAGIYYASRSIILNKNHADRDRGILIPASVALVSFFVIKSVFSQQDNHPLIFMLLGLITAICYRVGRDTSPQHRIFD